MEMRELSDVLVADGPFVTVLVEAESDVEQAAQKYDLVWSGVERELADEGVNEATVQAVLEAKGGHADGSARLVVASTDDHSVKLVTSLRHAPQRPVVDVAPLPHLLPLVDELAQRVPFVLLRCDRAGATVEAFHDLGTPGVTETGDASTGMGTDPRGPSKWQHTAHQHQYETNWIGNVAQDIVRTLQRAADLVHPQLVIGVGDVRELTAVRDHLPGDLAPLWRTVDGGRGQDGSEELVWQRVSDLVHQHVAQGELDLLARFAQERGQRDRAADGLDATVAALQKAQVETLLLCTGADAERRLWFGPEPAQVGVSGEQLASMGVPMPSSGPVLDVLLRAAIGTGADVRRVAAEHPDAPRAGVGALLRYADSSTP